MNNLFLLRHAKSSWNDAALDDFHRPVSDRGINDALLMGKYLALNQIHFDLVFSSSSERTQATFDLIFSQTFETPALQIKDSLYHASSEIIQELLVMQKSTILNILIIGHNPGLHLLTEKLTGQQLDHFPTCSLVKLSNLSSWKDLKIGILDLELFVTPEDLKHDGFKS